MKKLLPLILIIVFLSAQYGRVASYYHCVILNVVKNDVTGDCGCEKILVSNTDAENAGPSQILHISHNTPDEYYFAYSQENNFECIPLAQCFNNAYNNHYKFIFKNVLAIPPEC